MTAAAEKVRKSCPVRVSTNGYQLINRADVGGKYQGAWQTAQATWLTVIRKLTPTYVPTLPKTL